MTANGKQEPTVSQEPLSGVVEEVLALLKTRCGCEQILKVPNPPPRTVTVELAPVPGDEKASRVFYLGQHAVINAEGQSLLVYFEGPARDRPRILVPGMGPPKGPLRLAA